MWANESFILCASAAQPQGRQKVIASNTTSRQTNNFSRFRICIQPPFFVKWLLKYISATNLCRTYQLLLITSSASRVFILVQN
jgi:hypothetical protein